MSKKLVVLSLSCQGAVLENLLLSNEAFRDEYEVRFLVNYELRSGQIRPAPRGELVQSALDCDVLVYHDVAAYDFPTLLSRLRSDVKVFKTPYVTCSIYWPNIDFQRPLGLGDGGQGGLIPWPCPFLDELIVELHDKKRILDAYLSLDLAGLIDVDANTQFQLAHIHNAEQGTIFNLAEITTGRFRTERLHHLYNHPAAALLVHMADALLAALGKPALDPPPHDPFGEHQTPVHPSIRQKLGLVWRDPGDKVNLLGRRMDFEEYTHFYIDAYIAKFGYNRLPAPPGNNAERLTGCVRHFACGETAGKRENTLGFASLTSLAERINEKIQLRSRKTRLLKSGLFNAPWYLENQPDVAAAGFDPAVHFLVHGMREQRLPSPGFDWRRDAQRLLSALETPVAAPTGPACAADVKRPPDKP